MRQFERRMPPEAKSRALSKQIQTDPLPTEVCTSFNVNPLGCRPALLPFSMARLIWLSLS